VTKTILASVLAVAFSASVAAAEIVPVNADPAGQGLNDMTPAVPAGGNPGTTVGEQRRIAYQFAADLWGSVLQSPAQIRVEASFQPLECVPGRTVLGSAGTVPIYILSGGSLPPTLFHGALADALIGQDLQNGASIDIRSRFNSSYGGTNPNGTPCAPGAGWYYGLDGNTPAGLTNFFNVVMHEIAHGLGFSGFGNVSTGAPLAGYRDIYSSFVFDNNAQKGWYELTNAGRVAAVVGGGLVFRGPNVTAGVPLVLDEMLTLRASGTVSGDFAFGTAAFGAPATPANFNGSLVLANDGSAAPTLGCVASPAGAYSGRIAVVDRGSCEFEVKVKHAEDAGALGVVIASTGAIANMGQGSDPARVATIPSLMVSFASGAALKAGLPGVDVNIAPIPGLLAGADSHGYARLYAPNPVQPGSSFSHYDTSASPNALMEPAITSTLVANLNVDLTNALFQDEGWSINPGTAKIAGCDTGIAIASEGGLIVGASVQAWDNLCLASSAGKGEYQDCISGYKDRLAAAGLLTGNQGGRIASCAAKRFK
jgi:hypothetical protein